MDDPNMTIEEYIKLEEEKARRHGRVFNWQTATYGKITVRDDLYDLRSVEVEFPAIVIDDAFAPKDTLPCKSQVSTPVNDKIDFRISFDESDDEDYTIICDKNSFFYKMIPVNNLNIDSENDNEKAAIVYNDAQTSKSTLLTEPILSPQHIDEFNLNDETSLSEYDEEEQNVLYFNDLFPFHVIHPNDLKSDEDNDNNKIDIIQSLEEAKGLEYTDADIADFEERLERIYGREIHRVQVVDFLGMPELMRDGLFARMVMEHRDDAGGDRRRLSWRQFILALGLHTREEMESPGFARFLGISPFLHFDQRSGIRLFHRIMAHSIAGRSQAPEKVIVTDLFYLRGMDVGSVNVPYLLARYLLFAAGRKSGAYISGGQFVALLAEHFGLLTMEILGGLTVIALELSIIDMAELALEQPAPPSPPASARTMPQRLGRLEEEEQGLRRDVGTLRGLVERSMTDQGRFSTCMMSCMSQLMDIVWLTLPRHSMGLSEEAHLQHSRDIPDRGLARLAPSQHSRTHSS
ncbi:hypothetical protein Tco_0502789 [Tanacetum coccineum]